MKRLHNFSLVRLVAFVIVHPPFGSKLIRLDEVAARVIG